MRQISYSDAIREALTEELRRDEDVFLMGEDIGAYGGAFGVTRGLIDEFGAERVMDTPISEGTTAGAAIGAALEGRRPVVEFMFMDFIALAADQLLNQAAKLRYVFGEQASCPLVIRTPTGGGRCYGPTHSQSLEAWFVHVPGLKVIAPATPYDAKSLLKTAVRDPDPVLFLEHKMLYKQQGQVADDDEHDDCRGILPLGEARIAREGQDITIVAWSGMTREAEKAAEELEKSDVEAEVVDMRTLSPMDTETLLASVRKTGCVLIVQEAPRTGGVGGEISARISENIYEYLDAPVRRLASPDVPFPASPVLEERMIPDKNRIVEVAVEMLEEGI